MIKKIIIAFLAFMSWQDSFAITLSEISAQLQQHPITEGKFQQERYLKDLPNPLIINGHFVLAIDKGLLWNITSPLKQNIKINHQGLWQEQNDRWIQTQGNSDKERQQMALFLNLFSGDFSGLESSFSISSEGTIDSWQAELLPNRLLMKQIFTKIIISGGNTIHKIDLYEKQGDKVSIIFSDESFPESLNQTAEKILQK